MHLYSRLTAAIALMATALPAQIIRGPDAPADSVHATQPGQPLDASAVRMQQQDFERFRRQNLPATHQSAPSTCDEVVGEYCYWYNEKDLLPKEPPIIARQRDRFIATLDTAARLWPRDRWVAGQRVRYLEEAQRPDDAFAAAKECRADGWWCGALVGFTEHLRGNYVAAESAYDAVLAKMGTIDRCAWLDMELLLDDDARQAYRRTPCGDPTRRRFEDRAWLLARTLYSGPANDSRTEHFARMTMAQILTDAPGPETGFDENDRELLLRFGWPRTWAIEGGAPVSIGMRPGFPGGMGGYGIGRRRWRGPGATATPTVNDASIVGAEPVPAYRYIPPGFVLNDAAMSDSAAWRLQLPPVIGRYAPPYAKSLTPLEHQKAMFKRGDSALVVLAYDARVTKQLDGAKISAGLVVIPNGENNSYGTIVQDAPRTGVLTAKAPWGPLLMSAEVAAPSKQAVARARYGVLPPYAVGTRVTLSDLLFYKPYGTFPATAEEAAPHAVPTERLRADEKLGVYWEAYGTDPTGEKMGISLTVLRELDSDQGGFMKRLGKALHVVREATPVTVSVSDVSARDATLSPRALEIDMSTLTKGSYIVQLEIDVTGQPIIRADHRIEIIAP